MRPLRHAHVSNFGSAGHLGPRGVGGRRGDGSPLRSPIAFTRITPRGRRLLRCHRPAHGARHVSGVSLVRYRGWPTPACGSPDVATGDASRRAARRIIHDRPSQSFDRFGHQFRRRLAVRVRSSATDGVPSTAVMEACTRNVPGPSARWTRRVSYATRAPLLDPVVRVLRNDGRHDGRFDLSYDRSDRPG